MSAPNSKKRRYIAPRLVIESFGAQAADALLAIVIDAHELTTEGRLRLRGFHGEEFDLTVVDPEAVTAALARDDLTRVKGHPLLLVNRRYRLIAIATGPPDPPSPLQVLAHVTVLGEHGAEEIPGDEGQPSWLLFDVADAKHQGGPGS